MPRATHQPSRQQQVAFIECKTFGHAWDEYNPTDVPELQPGMYFDRITLRCTRCHTTRHDYLDRSGGVEYRNYTYTDGYRDTRDQPRPSRAVLRLLLHGHTPNHQ